MDFFNNTNLLQMFLKLFSIVVAFLYMFFAWVLIKQIQSLEKTVDIHEDGLLVLLARIQLVLAIVIVLLALFIL